MSWIKRNLFFAISSAVALALMGLAGYFAYSKWAANNAAWESLSNDYETLRRLNSAPILPGDDKINNIQIAQGQQTQLLAFVTSARTHFQRIPPIPDQPRVSDQDFSTALGITLNRLQRDATNNSVTLTQPDYSFSFQAEKNRVSFNAAGLAPLSVQLGDVKAICDVLFQAKINALDNIRRERVSADDSTGSQSDYLVEKSVTNDLAIVTPYEITFKSFSSELAAVLSGFAASSNAIVVKTINVKSAPPAASAEPGAAPTTYAPQTYVQPRQEMDAAAAFRSRYGISPTGGNPYGAGRYSGGSANLGGIQYRPLQPSQPTYAPQPVPTAPQPAAQVNKGGLPTVLDEKQLEVTINLALIKLLPPKPGK